MVAKNDITGDFIKTRGGLSKEGEDNFDKIFGKRDVRGKKIELAEYPEDPDAWDERRMDVIGSNGPTGLHYEGEGND